MTKLPMAALRAVAPPAVERCARVAGTSVVAALLFLVSGVAAANEESETLVLASLALEHRVTAYDMSGNVVASAPTGIEPRGMLLHGDRIIVANRGRTALPGSSLTILDRDTLAPERTVLACMRCGPTELVTTEDDTLLVLGQLDRTIVRLPAPYEEPTGSALIAWAWPSRMALVEPDGKIAIGMRGGDQIAVVDMSEQTPTWSQRMVTLSPTWISKRPGHDEYWVASERGRLVRIPADALEDPDVELDTLKGPPAILDSLWDSAGRRLYVASGARQAVIAIDPGSGDEVATWATPSPPHVLELAPDGRTLAVGLTGGRILLLRVQNDGSLALDREWKTPGRVGDVLWLERGHAGKE